LRIGIFASGEDAGARAVYKALARIRGVSCCLFDLSRGPAKAEVHSNGLVVEGEDLALLDLAYVRGFAHAVPLAPDPGPDRDWTVWQADWPIRVQRHIDHIGIIGKRAISRKRAFSHHVDLCFH